MRGADLLIRCLEAEGVRHIFGLPGEEILDILDALHGSSITFLPTRHEQGAAFMADVQGRLTGKAGVCLATLGPGATNLSTGIADATLDHVPLVALTGQAGRDRHHKESHQYIDTVEHFRPITKWSARVEMARVLPEIVRKAFKTAQSEKPGACHLEISEDVAAEETTEGPLRGERPRRPSPDRLSLRRAAEFIEDASSPLLFVGNGAVRGRASSALQAFAEKTRIPVVTTFMAKGCLPADHELSLMTAGLQARDYISFGFDQADLIITVGYDPVEYAPRFWNPNRDKRIVHLDFVPAEVDSYYPPAVEIVADIRETLELLTDLAKEKAERTFVKTLREWIHTQLQENARDDSFPLKPQRILHDLRSVLGREDILLSDVGAHKLWVARLYPAYAPNTVLISNGYAAMGFALPGAIAAKLLSPERRVAVVCGDGGFLMNVQELETARRLNLSFVTVIFRDDAYGVIQWNQRRRFGRELGVTFANPDFVKLAEAFGARGYVVQAAGELVPILEEAFRFPGPSVVEVAVDYSENLRLAEKMGQLVCPL